MVRLRGSNLKGELMRLGLNLGYWATGQSTDVKLVQEAEAIGYESVWVPEAYSSDAVTVLSWLGAETEHIALGTGLLQIPARSPAMTAMTAATLDELSGGRVRLGLGASGPQVAEGWHGVPYGKPLGKTREYVEILRKIWAREERVTYDGDHYQLPYMGEDATGLGKPLKLIFHPRRADIPIYLAAIGPKNVALTAEIADGWLPMFYSPERAPAVFEDALRDGFERSGDPGKQDRFDVAPAAYAHVTDDVEAARDAVRPVVALYVGGMGAKGTNFYNDLASRYGFEGAAGEIQDLYLSGNKKEAIAAVPDSLIDETNLFGSPAAVKDRLEAWRESGVTSLLISPGDEDTLRILPELLS